MTISKYIAKAPYFLGRGLIHAGFADYLFVDSSLLIELKFSAHGSVDIHDVFFL